MRSGFLHFNTKEILYINLTLADNFKSNNDIIQTDLFDVEFSSIVEQRLGKIDHKDFIFNIFSKKRI